MKPELQRMKQSLADAIFDYVNAFAAKHDLPIDYCVADELTGIWCFGDYFFSIETIIFDIENEVPKRYLFSWYDFMLETENKINYKSFIKMNTNA